MLICVADRAIRFLLCVYFKAITMCFIIDCLGQHTSEVALLIKKIYCPINVINTYNVINATPSSLMCYSVYVTKCEI